MPTLSQCPRCDYDLSGETSRWEERCPVRGVCPECGLEFAWGEVLNADLRRVPGFVEHTRGIFRTYVAAWRTWWWVIRPWVFWSRVRITHLVRVRRAVLWIVLLLLPLHLLRAVPLFVEWYNIWTTWRGSTLANVIEGERLGATLAWPVVPRGSYRMSLDLAHRDDLAGAIPVLFLCILWPVLLLGLPFTRQLARIHSRHILRATCYSMWWLLPVWVLQSIYLLFSAGHSMLRGRPSNTMQDLAYACESTANLAEVVLHVIGCPAFATLLVGAWLLAWWYWAVCKVFKLPRARFVWGVLAAVDLFGGAVGFVVGHTVRAWLLWW